MGLRDDALQDATGRPKGPQCAISILLKTDIAAELKEALDDPDCPSSSIARELAKRMPKAPRAETIQRHRRGDCVCGSGRRRAGT